MYIIYILPLTIFILTFIHGFFANSEMAMVSLNKIKLQHLANKGNKKAIIIQNLLNKPERLFGTTLVAINIATVTSSTLADYYFHEFLYNELTIIHNYVPLELLILLIMEPLILVFGELFPMSIARNYPNSTAMRNARFIQIGYILLFPLMFLTSLISKFITFISLRSDNKYNKLSREELELMVGGGFLNVTNKTQEYIKELFNINELIASDVMVHLNNVNAIKEDATVKEIKDMIISTNNSRIPLYKGDIFHIVSTVHAVNILGADEKYPANQYSDKLYIVPSTKPIIQILSEFKRNRKYMGIVVDEYGATSGIITLEDIMEEIVGEIYDEFDEPDVIEEIKSEDIFDASIRLDEFFEQTGIDLREDKVETLGGIINLAAGRIARTNEKITYKGYKFEVIDANDRAIRSIRLIKPYQ